MAVLVIADHDGSAVRDTTNKTVTAALSHDQDIDVLADSIIDRMREPFVYAERILDCRTSIGASAPLDEIDEAIMRILAGEEPSAEPSAGDESGTVDEPGTGDDEDRPGAGGTEEKH